MVTDDYIHDITVNVNSNNDVYLFSLIWSKNLQIYNFYNGNLIKSIDINCDRKMCLWDNEYIFVAGKNPIKLIDIETGKIIKTLNGEASISYLCKYEHPLYGQCLVSKCNENNIIKLWGFKN